MYHALFLLLNISNTYMYRRMCRNSSWWPARQRFL